MVTSLCLPLLRRAAAPLVVFITSVAARHGAPSATIYSASKGALDSLTRGLSAELAPDIRVNAVAPGVIETPFHDKVSTPERMKQFAEKAALRRNGRAEHIAKTIRFVVENDFMTGETIDVDGGIHMRQARVAGSTAGSSRAAGSTPADPVSTFPRTHTRGRGSGPSSCRRPRR